MSTSRSSSILPVLNNICSGIDVSQQERMSYETLRLVTFQRYPANKPSTIRFAQAGFYFSGNGDEVSCYCCGVRVNNWTDDDVPMDVHVRVSPNCPFIVYNNSVNVAVTDMSTIPTTACSTVRQNHTTEPLGEPPRVFGARGESRSMVHHPNSQTKRLPNGLAETGFFYTGTDDCVRCFHCGLGLKDWEESDDPWTVHAKHRNTCPFVLEEKCQDLMNSVQQASVEESKTSIKSDGTPTAVSHQDPCDRETRSSTTHEMMTKSGNTLPQEDDEVPLGLMSAGEPLELSEFIDLRRERLLRPDRRARRLMAMTKCCICQTTDINITFLPCGHRVCCAECMSCFGLCVVCYAQIKAFRVRRQ